LLRNAYTVQKMYRRIMKAQEPSIFEHILIVGPGIPEKSILDIEKAWIDAGIVDYGILGDGKRGVSGNEIGEVLQYSGEHTHIYYFGHGSAKNGEHTIDITGHSASTHLLLGNSDYAPGIRHVFSCYAGAAKNAVEDFPEGVPIIFYSGAKYTTLIAMSSDSIGAQAKFSKDRDVCGSYTAFERSMLTSPETVNISVKVGNKIKTFKAKAPNFMNEAGPVGEKGLELYLQAQLKEFREWRKSALGHTKCMFVDMTPLMTKENRMRYLELAMIMEAGREKSKHAVKYIQGYLDSGVDVDCALSDGTNSLYFAVQDGNLDTVKVLLENGAKVNGVYRDGFRPLLTACEKGHLDIVKLLLEKGAKIDKARPNGITPFYFSCQTGNLSVAKLLLENGADINKGLYGTFNPLMVAALTGKNQVIDLLLENIKDPAYLTRITDTKTAEKFCLDKKIDMPQRHRDLLGKSAADMARDAGHVEIAKKIEAKYKVLLKEKYSGKVGNECFGGHALL
jgi:hypothetical protein